MPDLQPDTSLYGVIANNANSGPLARMSLGDLLNLAQQSRTFQTGVALSDALKQNVDPTTGQPNYQGTMKSLLANPNAGAVTPQMTQAITGAQSSQYELGLSQTKTAVDAVSSLVNYGGAGSQTVPMDAVRQITPILARAGVPPQTIQQTLLSAENPDGTLDKTKLVTLRNWLSGGAAAPSVNLPTAGGATAPVSGGSFNYQLQAPGGAGASRAGGPGGFMPGPTGAPLTSAPAGFQGTLEQSAGASNKIRDTQFLPTQYANLENLRDLSDEATSGPQADFEKRANELAQRFGLPGLTLSPDQLKYTEKYAKVAEQLVQQSPAFGHSDAFLQNAYGANPNLTLSKLGREGITQWLLGSVDAQKTMINQWNGWLQGHPGQDNQFYNWLNAKYMPDGTKGFDATNFDPRVFQYERMDPNDQAKFRGMIKGKGQLGLFASHLRQYETNGWVGGGGENSAQAP